MNSQRTIYTVGYSTHELEFFIGLLKQHEITAVADVRSHPSSRWTHFCRAELQSHLKNVGIDYVYLGNELGARRDERECYIDGAVVYDLVAMLPKFREGLERLERGVAEHRIALMCAEKEPLDCHRSILIARHLAAEGWRVRHILVDGSVEEHTQTEDRLVKEMDIARTLFEPNLSRDELVQQAYQKRGKEIAYRVEEENVPE